MADATIHFWVSSDDSIEEEGFMARKIFGDDRRRLTSLQADLDSIAVRDTRAAAADPSAGKVVFFPQADTALQAALTAVRTRITNLLAMQTT